MAKTDFKPTMIRNVEFNFPRLGATFKFNTAEKRSEECKPQANGAAYSVAWNMPAQDAAKLHAELKEHYESCGRPTPFTKVFGCKKNDDGTVKFSAKRNGTNANGEVNEKPRVIDGMKQPLADVNIWGGSKGNIKVTAYPVTDPDGNGGISLLIDTVQVVHAVYGGNNLDDFDEFTDGTSSGGGQPKELDDFAAVADPFSDVAPKASNADLDEDDLPL